MGGNDRGFTLLEVMVAFVIAAMATGALLQGVGGGLLSTRVAAHTQEAVARARSRLAALNAAMPQPGEQRGDDGGGFTWQSRVTPVAATGKPPPGQERAKRAALYTLMVSVGWTMDGGAREVVLQTQRVGDTPPDTP